MASYKIGKITGVKPIKTPKLSKPSSVGKVSIPKVRSVRGSRIKIKG